VDTISCIDVARISGTHIVVRAILVSHDNTSRVVTANLLTRGVRNIERKVQAQSCRRIARVYSTNVLIVTVHVFRRQVPTCIYVADDHLAEVSCWLVLFCEKALSSSFNTAVSSANGLIITNFRSEHTFSSRSITRIFGTLAVVIALFL